MFKSQNSRVHWADKAQEENEYLQFAQILKIQQQQH